MSRSSAQALGGEVAGLRISLPTLDIAVETASRLAVSGQGFTLFTLNLDHLVKIRADAAFRAAGGCDTPYSRLNS